MDASAKRKNPPGGASQRHVKKSKGSSAGKYVTPHHKAKLEALKAKGRRLDVGDVGFWVTCQRNQENKALEEIISVCDEYGEKLYGITPQPAPGEGEDEDEVDIEAAIQKEVEAMKQSKTPDSSVFAPLRLPLDCLIFVKTKPPVEPRQFVRSIVDDAKLVSDRTQRRSRFINRLTPITLTGRATEAGLDELAKEVLAPEFQLVGAEAGTGSETTEDKDMGASYCIRLSSRAHSTLKREDIIKQVAGLIGPRHKVNLTSPDKVILIEIFQTFCGMSVVDGEWDSLKRYNIRELYETATRRADEEKKAEQAADKPKTEEPEAEAANTTAEAKAEEEPEQPHDAAAAATA